MVTIHKPNGDKVATVTSVKDVWGRSRKLPFGGYVVRENGVRIASVIVGYSMRPIMGERRTQVSLSKV